MADGGLHGKGQVGGEALSPQRDLLRFITCGSVDDGKSTLIGRLLYDAGAPPQDELERLERDSRRSGSAAGRLDFSLLVDGLAAERESLWARLEGATFLTLEEKRRLAGLSHAPAPSHASPLSEVSDG